MGGFLRLHSVSKGRRLLLVVLEAEPRPYTVQASASSLRDRPLGEGFEIWRVAGSDPECIRSF